MSFSQDRKGLTMYTQARVWIYGDDVNTDVIFPGKYTYTLRQPEEIAAHALEDLDLEFTRSASQGDIIVAGRNWGMGSSREQAVTCLVYRGIRAVIARSFARIYYRNGINQGLLLLICPQAVDLAQPGCQIEIDLPASRVLVDGQACSFPPLSPTALSILQAGGLVPFIRRKLDLPSTDGEPSIHG